MAKIKARLARILARLTSNDAQLKRARKRYKASRALATKNHAKAIKAQEAGDQDKADRCNHRAYKAHLRAQYWLGKVKVCVQRKEGLETHEHAIETELAKWKKEHGVVVSGNKVEGGTPRQRLRAALLRAMLNYQRGKQPGYYSQSGAERLYGKMLEGMPYGHIFDCSTFADGIYFCCGLKDPSDTDYHEGYTGTEGAHGKEVPVGMAKTGDLVLYGPFPHHHVEVVLDPGAKTTCGHGSPPIDKGVFDLFGDSDYLVRSYL